MKSLLVSRRTTDANELAAKLWRVWVYARDNKGGREFSLVLDRPAATATRAHALALPEETQSMLASHNIKLASDDQLEFDRLSKQVAPQ